MINIQSTLRTAPDLCKNVSIAVLFGSNNNSYTVSTESEMWIYTQILHNIETLVGQKKFKNWNISECSVQSTLHTAPDLCKNVSIAVLFDSNNNSYTVSTESNTYKCTYNYFSQYRDGGLGQECMRRIKEIVPRAASSVKLA